jgi:hypothetical protein
MKLEIFVTKKDRSKGTVFHKIGRKNYQITTRSKSGWNILSPAFTLKAL